MARKAKNPRQEPMPACTHTGATLARAMLVVRSELGLPAFMRKSDLRRMHENYEEWMPALVEYFRNNEHDDHAVAAVCAIWSRLFIDVELAGKLSKDPSFEFALRDVLRPSRCDLRSVFTAFLSLSAVERGYAHLSQTLFSPLLGLLRAYKPEHLAHDICHEALGYVLSRIWTDENDEEVSYVLQEEILEHCVDLAGAVPAKTFFGVLGTLAEEFQLGQLRHPTHISPRYGAFLVGWMRAGRADHRRDAYAQLVATRFRFQGRQHFVHGKPRTGIPPHVLYSLRARMPNIGDFERLERTAATCSDLLLELKESGDIGRAGLRFFQIVHDNPRGAHIDEETWDRFGLTGALPDHDSGSFLDSKNVVLAMSGAVMDLDLTDVERFFAATGVSPSPPLDYMSYVLRFQHDILQDWEYDFSFEVDDALVSYPDDAWLLFALACISNDAEKMLEGDMEFDVLKAFFDRAAHVALSASSPLHLALRAKIAETAFLTATSAWCANRVGWEKWRALLLFADDLAQRYIADAAPDGVDLLAMLEIPIITRLLRDGPDISRDLSELRPLIDRYHDTEKLMLALYGDDRELETAHALHYVLHTYPVGLAWQPRLRPYAPNAGRAEFDSFEPEGWDPPDHKAINRTWMLRVLMDEETDWSAMPLAVVRTLISPPLSLWYRLHPCTTCHRRSARVRACAGCREAMYCDTDCQWLHWVGQGGDGCHRDECSRMYPFRVHGADKKR